MSLILHSKNRTLTVKVKGELDLVTAHHFREKADRALEEISGLYLILDLAKVTFIDSSGLGVILGRFRKIKAKGGQMILVGLTGNTRRILEMAGILSFIPVCSSEAEAWKLIEKKSFKGA